MPPRSLESSASLYPCLHHHLPICPRPKAVGNLLSKATRVLFRYTTSLRSLRSPTTRTLTLFLHNVDRVQPASNTTREYSHSSYSSVNSFYHTSGGLGSDDSEPLEGAVKDDDEGHDKDSVSFTLSIPRFTSFFNVSSLIASWLMTMILSLIYRKTQDYRLY